MSSKLFYQEDNIQLIELSSDKTSTDNISKSQSPSSLTKFRKRNKIQSPTIQSSNLSQSSSSKISDVFVVKQNTDTTKNQEKPIPAPRNLKKNKQKLNVNTSTNELEIVKSAETTDSAEIQSLFSHKSDTLSYKNKLRSRFLTLKKQAEKSLINSENQIDKKKRSIDITDDILQNENIVITNELNKYEKNKSKYTTVDISDYDFFCSINEKEQETTQTESQIENVDTKSDVSKKSIDEFIGINNLDKDFIEYLHPEIVDIEANELLLFKPFKKTKYFEKQHIKHDIKLRNLEQEGLYKAEKPKLSSYELNMLYEKLIHDENKDWFDSNEDITILSDPRLNNYYKPFNMNVKHTDFVNKYTPPTLYEPLENIIDIYNNTLEINIREIRFSHHPLFSSEHILAQKLINLYENFTKIISTNVFLICQKKVEALRCAKKRLNIKIKSVDNLNVTEINRFEKYIQDIKENREKMYYEGKKERTLKKEILLLWKAIKKLRKTQKHSNTRIKLIINKEYNDYEEERKNWEKNITDELSEILEEHEQNYQSQLEKYKNKLKQWKFQKNNVNKDLEDNIEHTLKEKPKKPKLIFDEEQVMNEILERCNGSLKPPGEPILHFKIEFNGEISNEIDNPKEKIRRNYVNKSRIYIRLVCNEREICKSKNVILSENFIYNINEIISIKLSKMPKFLILEIYEFSNAINKHLLAEIALNIPNFDSTVRDIDVQKIEFINKNIIKYNHTALGTGLNMEDVLKEYNLNLSDTNYQLFCSGDFYFSVGWIIEENLESKFKNINTIQEYIPTFFNIANVEKFIEKYPDPQDPQNILLFDYIQNLQTKTEAEKNYFRLDPDLQSLQFCLDKDIDNNPRFKLLKFRHNNEPEFRNLIVPNRIKEIPVDIFKSYEKRRNEEKVTTEIVIDQFEDEDIDTQRKWADKYLTQIENRIIKLNKIAERKVSLKDVLNEEIISSLSSFSLLFMYWLRPKRNLQPIREHMKQVSIAITFKKMNILVNVISAFQVPKRKDLKFIHETTSPRSDQVTITPVRPFVNVSFQDHSFRTNTAQGTNPVWNQEFNISLRHNNEQMTVEELQNMKDSLIFDLFDETEDDLVIDDRLRSTNIHKQLGCNWLGRLEIPFHTFLYNNRIEGTFKLNLPTILLSYERQSIKTFSVSGEPFAQKLESFITISVTLNPAVANLQPLLKTELPCCETQHVEQHITNWQNEFNLQYPQRQFSSFVTTVNGERCCITRYLKPIKLPQLNSEITTANEQQCAKYVSLIPFRENSVPNYIPDIWLTPEQFLTIMMGSINDHAVLLTCYFMTLEIKCWLLFGYGMPYGYTTYVLIRENRARGYEYYIYDVTSGQKYNIYESICPLQKVFCVVNEDNVWANIQCDNQLHLTKLDFTKSSDWLQLFGRNISAPTITFQQININYVDGPTVLYLQEKIEKKIRKKIMKWRKHSRTIWNHYCNLSFKKILSKLHEQSMQHSTIISSSEHFTEMQNLLSSYKIEGFATNFPYINMRTLIDFVRTTGIYTNDHPNIEFSLAVYAQSYCNNVVIIWLYLATLVRKS